MFGQVRNSSFEDIFNFQRDVDRFNQFLSDPPARAGQTARTYPFQVHTAEDSWRVEIPMPGVDPTHVTLEVAGNTIAVRVEQDSGRNDGAAQWEQTMTVPRILDLDGIRATHRHGMDFNNLPETQFRDVKRVLHVSTERVATRLRDLRH